MIAMRARSNDSNNDDSLYMMTLCILCALSVYWCQWHIPIVMMITLQQRSNITILRWWWLRWHTYETLTKTLSHFILAGKRCSQTQLLRWQWLLWRWLWRWILWRSWHHIDTTSPMQYARHSDFGLVPRAAPVILWHWWHTHVPVATAVTLVTHRQRHLEYCDDADFGDRAVTHASNAAASLSLPFNRTSCMELPPIKASTVSSREFKLCLWLCLVSSFPILEWPGNQTPMTLWRNDPLWLLGGFEDARCLTNPVKRCNFTIFTML